MTEKMKTTAPVLSVGADREQPNTKNHKEIIANETAQINHATISVSVKLNSILKRRSRIRMKKSKS